MLELEEDLPEKHKEHEAQKPKLLPKVRLCGLCAFVVNFY
jgi:hypothetical protein